MGTISGCRHLKVNLKAKVYINDNTSTQRYPNKIIKIFLIEDFFHLPPVLATPVVRLEFETALMVYSGAWGKLIYEKNQKSKISWHCPFNPICIQAVGHQNTLALGLIRHMDRLKYGSALTYPNNVRNSGEDHLRYKRTPMLRNVV